MKFSEAIELLKEYYNLEFKSEMPNNNGYFKLYMNEDGVYIINSYNKHWELVKSSVATDLNLEWTIMDEQMSFQQLLKVENLQNKLISVESNGFTTAYYDLFINIMIDLVHNLDSNEKIIKVMKNGKWYIKDDI